MEKMLFRKYEEKMIIVGGYPPNPLPPSAEVNTMFSPIVNKKAKHWYFKTNNTFKQKRSI